MKKTLKISVTAVSMVCCLLSLGACSDFLDVQPDDRFLESHVFTSELGVQEFFNGIYLRMSKPTLYGGNLTMSTVEAIGQQYNTSLATGSNSSQPGWAIFGNYRYSDPNVRNRFGGIWKEAYVTIMNINDFLEKLDANPGVLRDRHATLLKGEAMGLRAFVHFDLLRLYGPVYSENPGEQAIPYYTKADAEVADLLPATDVIERVLKDLEAAEELLAEDPIITNGVLHNGDFSEEAFYEWRNYRLNYYAVKAMQARVHLYAGNTAEALAAAQVVIDANEAKGTFPWSDPDDIFSGGKPDRVFSSEVIFGVYNPNLYGQHDRLFDVSMHHQTLLLTIHQSRVGSVYENNENDFRFSTWWKIPTGGSYGGRTFFKFSDVTDTNAEFRFLQPLIRMSEMYYIAAETHPDPAVGLAYLNTVRFNRGLTDLEAGADLQAEIEKEYRKEFCGEGQMFFYYKRHAMAKIPNGSSSFITSTINMDDSKYVVPLPDSEIEFRN